MKKILSVCFMFLICLFTLTACEEGNNLRTASFTNITSAGSEDYAVKIVFSDDKRVDNKYYDIQIKADGIKKIKIGKENQERKEVTLTEDWNSLTTLLVEQANTETFTKGSEAVSLIYIFNADYKTKVTFRAVVGGIEENASKTGYILTSSEDCSNEFSIQTK